MDALDRLNRLPVEAAEAELLQCCGSARWARGVAARRPFPDISALLGAADDVWWALEGADWLEAFRAHPRIGERKAPAPGTDRGARWSEQEQAGARAADAAVLVELERSNREYEARFGHIFLICATGKSAAEMLAQLRERLGNDAARELRVAAGEQCKITRIRLEKLLSP